MSDLSFFDSVYVINLDSRKDRLETVMPHLHEYGFKNVIRVPAISPDMKKITKNMYSEFKHGPDRRESFDLYVKGAIGCLRSHIKVLEHAIANNNRNYLIFEDDVRLQAGSQEQLIKTIDELIKRDWDMFYLGGIHIRDSRKPIENTSALVRVTRTVNAHAYAVNSTFYMTLQDALSQCCAEVDRFYSKYIQPTHNCYCINPDIATQSDSPTSIQTKVLPRKKISRWVHSAIGLITAKKTNHNATR